MAKIEGWCHQVQPCKVWLIPKDIQALKPKYGYLVLEINTETFLYGLNQNWSLQQIFKFGCYPFIIAIICLRESN